MATVSFIRDKARAVLTEFKVTNPPVPIRDIVEGHLLKIVEKEGMGEDDGSLIPEKRQIELNMERTQAAQRFTLAHELGHWVLYHKDRLMERDENIGGIYDDRTDEEAARTPEQMSRETEANIFAAELLMPTQWIKASWGEHKNVDVLAKLYEVSGEAMWYRVIELSLIKK